MAPAPSPQPQPKGENGALHELLMQRKVKTVFSKHVMCVLFCFPLLAACAEKKLAVTMGSQAAYAARALRQPRPPLRGHIFFGAALVGGVLGVPRKLKN